MRGSGGAASNSSPPQNRASHSDARGMLGFIQSLWGLTRPYRGRLILGIFFGVIAGVMEAVVVAVVYLVFSVIFPADAGGEIQQALDRIRTIAPAVADFLNHQLDSVRQDAGP